MSRSWCLISIWIVGFSQIHWRIGALPNKVCSFVSSFSYTPKTGVGEILLGQISPRGEHGQQRQDEQRDIKEHVEPDLVRNGERRIEHEPEQ